MDVFNKLLKAVDHNRYKTLGIVLAAVVAVWLVGCQPTVVSPVSGNKVDDATLQMEVANQQAVLARQQAELDAAIVAHNAQVEAFASQSALAFDELARQYEVRENVINTLGEFAIGIVTGNINPVNAVGAVSLLALTLFGGSSYLDGRRKDKVIAGKTRPSPAAEPGL